MKADEIRLLQLLANSAKEFGGKVEWEESVNHTLRIYFPVRQEQTMELNYTFIPQSQDATEKYLNLQMFAYISGEVDIAKSPKLPWLITKINRYLPLGAFGLLDEFDILYWKQNCFLDAKLQDEQHISAILAQTELAETVILDFKDTLLDVAIHQVDVIKALRNNKWGEALFGLKKDEKTV